MRNINLKLSVLAVMMILLLIGCSRKQTYTISEAGSWQDGTYIGTAEGRNGSFKVDIIIENGYITSIAADDNRETPERGGRAISVMLPNMVAAQSYDVDIVSGATITSKALRNAVAEVLEEASTTIL